MSTINVEPFEVSLLDARTRPRRSVAEAAERVTGFALLALASPAITASALLVAVLSRRSPFVAHLRVGRGGHPFWMWKLRTMWPSERPRRGAPRWVEYIAADPTGDSKVISDPRIRSRFAAFFRRHSIDELVQLWHVFRGEMALVGPRPLTRGEVQRHYEAHAAELLSVKPGMTGLWQVSGRSAIKFPERAALDLELVRTLKPKLYARVLLRTIPAVMRGNGAC